MKNVKRGYLSGKQSSKAALSTTEDEEREGLENYSNKYA